jgi:release factor glutamine methyltransferase
MTGREKHWLLHEKYAGTPTPEYLEDLARLDAGVPLAYIIGWVDFLGCRIDLASRPLIPRPETEWWVERVIERMREERPQRTDVLDIFSGSGCIGIAVLKHLPWTRVDFAEIDSAHIAIIRQNIRANEIDIGRTNVIESNGFAKIEETYDWILANPPYISSSDVASVEPSVLFHEPHLALFAEEEGLAFIELLLRDSPRHLRPGGSLALEFGKNQEKRVDEISRRYGWIPTIENDQYHIPRYGIFRRKE